VGIRNKSMSEREKLLSFLFDRDDRKVLNIKFFRGNATDLTVDQLCETALAVVRDTWEAEEQLADAPPLTETSRMKISELC